ncbi:MAG: hypothetical protein QJR02_08235 [Sinobacteraceae bacterium]|nr:hypothetical protein [Nevskiaceae bacterium]
MITKLLMFAASLVAVLLLALVIPVPAHSMNAPVEINQSVHPGLKTALAPTVICHESEPAVAIVKAIDAHQQDEDGGTAAARAVFQAANDAASRAGSHEVCYQTREPIVVTIDEVIYSGDSGWSVVSTDAPAARYAIVWAVPGTEI